MSIQSILLQLQQEKESKNILPAAVLYKDLKEACIKQGYCLEQIRNELNSLSVNKKIKVNRTINDKSIRLIE